MAEVSVPAIDRNAGKNTTGSTTTSTNKVGDSVMLSKSDQNTMNKLTEQWNAATAAGNTALADSIHKQAEAIRAGYGYSGGADGSGFVAVQTPQQQMMQPKFEVNSLENYLEDMYAAQAKAAEAQLKAAYDRNIGALDQAAENIPAIYRSARNRTAGESAVAGANFNEYAAAQGLGSGSAVQGQLARTNALQGGLSAIDQQEANALAEIEAERTQLMQQYQSAITEAKAQNKAALANALYAEMTRLQQEYQAFADRQAQWTYQLQQDQYARQLNEAKLAAQYGDLSRLGNMGILSVDTVGSPISRPSTPQPKASPVTEVIVPTVENPATGYDAAKVDRLVRQYRGFSKDAQYAALEHLMRNNGHLVSEAERQAIMDALGL